MSHFEFVTCKAEIQNKILANYVIAEIFPDLSAESLYFIRNFTALEGYLFSQAGRDRSKKPTSKYPRNLEQCVVRVWSCFDSLVSFLRSKSLGHTQKDHLFPWWQKLPRRFLNSWIHRPPLTQPCPPSVFRFTSASVSSQAPRASCHPTFTARAGYFSVPLHILFLFLPLTFPSRGPCLTCILHTYFDQSTRLRLLTFSLLKPCQPAASS